MKWIATLAAVSLVLTGCAQTTTNPGASPGTGTSDQLQDQANDTVMDAQDTLNNNAQVKTVTLQEQNDLGQTGTAVLTELDDSRVQVVLNMTGGNLTQPQPAHIHVGSCPNPGAVQYPLTNVVNGKSETTLSMSMEDIMNSSDKLAINVHKSAAEASVYTACGDLK